MWRTRANSTIAFGFLIIVVSLVLPASSRYQGFPFSIRACLGASYLPMTKASEFIGSWGYGDFKKTSINVTGAVGIDFAISEATSATLKIGLLETTSKFYPGIKEDPEAFATWKLQVVPVSLGLEYRLVEVSENVSVICGASFAGLFNQVWQSSNFGENGEPTVPRIRRYNFPKSKVTGTQTAIGGSPGVSNWITKSVSIVPAVDYSYTLDNIKTTVEDHYGGEAFPEIDLTNLAQSHERLVRGCGLNLVKSNEYLIHSSPNCNLTY